MHNEVWGCAETLPQRLQNTKIDIVVFLDESQVQLGTETSLL